jgi:hypothetical protein
MSGDEQDRLKKLLQDALPTVKNDDEPTRDLWPAVLRRIDTGPALSRWLWFDVGLLAGLVGAAALFPSAIPVLLYYL